MPQTKRLYLILLPLLAVGALLAQDLDLLDEDAPTTAYTIATFKTNRIVNGHSIETVAKREFDFKISHRFGFVNGGFYDLFGLDQATMRMGGDFGITDNLNVGIGRSNEDKTYDGFVKYKFLKQSKGAAKMPITAVWISHMGIASQKWAQPQRENIASSRLHYVHQLLIGRKISEGFSLQLSPTVVHKNLVDSTHRPNSIFSLGVGLRQKITNRVTINAEYFYNLPNQLEGDKTNALSVGFDIETGGHVFQLFFTNAAAPFEKGFITDTRAKWRDRNVRFGFNIARVFNY